MPPSSATSVPTPLGGLAVAGAVLVAVFNIFNLLAYSTTAGGM
jgi:hypothetical protein